MIRAGIIGASGYGGAELMRLLQAHPEFRVTFVASHSDAGKKIREVFPQLYGMGDEVFQPDDVNRAIEAADVFFLPVANGRAMRVAPDLLTAGRKVVDISADFRLHDRSVYEATYGIEHTCPGLLDEAVYGLTELCRDRVQQARLVANPGCYPTAAILSLAPLFMDRNGDSRLLADPDTVIVDAYSGVTGAGRNSMTLDFHFPEVNDSLSAYKAIGHRHTREIEQALAGWTGRPAVVTFTPHLAPINRGIHETVYATLTQGLSAAELQDLYERCYARDPFVAVLPPGLAPRTGAVRGSNMVQIGVNVDPRNRRLTILSAQDNLVKGMCGQAIQNMNLMCGLLETAGLQMHGMYP
jgi:N-acetyl-gamma-glutamyl-phosphate reductase